MTGDPPPATNPSVTGAVTTISERLIKVLPPAFLLLILMNCAFLGVVAWVFNHAAEARNVLLTKIVEQCLLKPPQGPR